VTGMVTGRFPFHYDSKRLTSGGRTQREKKSLG
jgi:hypothetical protein